MADARRPRRATIRKRRRAARRYFWAAFVDLRAADAVRADLSRAAARRDLQFVPRAAGDRAQRPDRAAAQLLASTPGSQAWGTYCVGGTCEGMKRNFFNSLWMTIPATIISTMLGAINGYVLSKWRFRGSEVLFTCMLLGVFMPGQIALMPWAFLLGKLGLTNSTYGLVLIHVRPGHLVHHAVLPQLSTSAFPTI